MMTAEAIRSPPPRAASDQPVARPSDVLVIDHERTFAESLAVALRASGWTVEAQTTTELVRSPPLPSRTSRIVVLGCSERSLREALTLLANFGPESRVVVLLDDPDDVALLPSVVRAGARGWACKSDSLTHLTRVVNEVSNGGWWLPRSVLGEALDALRRADSQRVAERFASLTARERQMLAGLVDGMSRNAIAARHDLSVNTVRTHIQHVFEKLEVHSSLEAVVLAQSRTMALSR
jgi:DNA-binding NarL/FixJ family response regulator